MSKPAQLFERLAERYDAWYDGDVGKVAFPIEVECLRPLLDGLSKPWLEVSVGTGRFAQALSVESELISPSDHSNSLVRENCCRQTSDKRYHTFVAYHEQIHVGAGEAPTFSGAFHRLLHRNCDS